MTESVVVTTPYLTAHLLSVILTGIHRVVVSMDGVVTRQDIVPVVPVQTTSLQSGGENQEVHRSGEMTVSVVVTTLYLTVHMVSVILTGRTLVVVIRGMESVVTLHNIVLVRTVQIIEFCTKIGKNREAPKSGEMTVSVVVTTPYLMVHLVSVILTGRNRVVTVRGMESVVTQQDIVPVEAVQTTSLLSGGENQEVHRCGDMTGGVVVTTPYLTVHPLSVILTGKYRVVMSMESVAAREHIVHVITVSTTEK